jgi:hypothetical protein
MIRGNKNKTKVKFTRAKKTKKTKIKEKKTFKRGTKNNKEKPVKMPDKNLGGFLPFPPKECQKKNHIIKCYGILWIDLNVCHSCTIIKECDTRKEHLQKLKEQRKLHFAQKGL